MKLSFEKIMKHIDWIAIPIGLLALISSISGCGSIFGIRSGCFTIIAGITCILYILYAAYLLILRPKFDWHLINGHFLRKVIAFVLLVPMFITSVFITFNSEYSPKNLVYDENLYTYDGSETDSLGIAKYELFTESAFLNAHNLELGCDSTLIQKNKLPQAIISKQEDPSIFWTVYYHFIDPGNQHMTTSQSGRGWAALIGILGVFLLNGLLVSSIIGWIDSRKEKWLKGEVKYPCFLRRKKHYVIIGGNDIVTGIVKQIISKKEYILIQTSNDIESFRRELFSNLTEEQQKLIIIYYGNRTAKEDIEKLHVKNAEEVYIIGEEIRTDDIESYHDTMNMECLSLIYKDFVSTRRVIVINWLNSAIVKLDNIIKKRGNSEDKFIQQVKIRLERARNTLKLTCRVMFEYQTSFSIFQFSEISSEIKTYIKFKPFNYYEMWAQKVLINKELDTYELKNNILSKGYLPLEGINGIPQDSDNYVHLFIVGMSRMGIAMAIEAAHLAHYPNYDKDRRIRTKITFIDKNASEEKDYFMGRFKELFGLSHWRYGAIQGNQLLWNCPHLPEKCDHLGGDFIDIEWEFINGGIENCGIQEYICSVVNKNDSIVTIAMCLPEPSRCLAAALYLDKNIYEKANQILVYNRYGDSLITQMTHKNEKQINPLHNKLRPFGMASECYDSKLITDAEAIAVMLNEKYDELYKDIDEGSGANKSDVAKWWSNIYAANSMWTKLRCTKWSNNRELNNREIYYLARIEHSRWNMEQLLLSYRPLTRTEQEVIKSDITQKNPKKGEMAHFDICSFEVLKQIDRNSIRYDWGLSKILPSIYTKLNMNITGQND